MLKSNKIYSSVNLLKTKPKINNSFGQYQLPKSKELNNFTVNRRYLNETECKRPSKTSHIDRRKRDNTEEEIPISKPSTKPYLFQRKLNRDNILLAYGRSTQLNRLAKNVNKSIEVMKKDGEGEYMKEM